MNDKLLPWFLLFCALGLSSTAAYYSVSGLATIFTGVTIPIIIMGGFLEISKIVTATYLHNAWKNTYFGLKWSLTLFLLVLMVITSLGIYGLLSKGFQENISGLEIDTKRISNIEVKKERYIETKNEYIIEKESSNKDISQLRNSLATGTMTQYKDRESGEIITVRSSSARKTFETQLALALEERNRISLKVEALNDSITNLDLKVLDMQVESETEGELGVIKYVNEITDIPIKKVANIFILMIIFVFDPLAILLVIATNQSFKNLKKKPKIITPTYEVYGEVEEKQITPIPTPTSPLPTSQIENLQKEIDKVSKSSLSEKRRLESINNLNAQIGKLKGDNENQIEYM